MEDNTGILMTSNKKSAWRIHTTGGHRRTSSRGRMHNIDTSSCPQVPEADTLVLWPGNKHGPAPGVQRQDVAGVARHGLERRHGVTVRHVHLAVPGSGGQQQRRTSASVLDKTTISNSSVMHRQVVLAALQRGAARVEVHQLDRLVVAAGGYQVTLGAPGKAVDGALVVLGPLEEDSRLVGLMVIGHLRHAWVLANTQRFWVWSNSVKFSSWMKLGTPHCLNILQSCHLQ